MRSNTPGPVVEALSMEGRLTLANLSIEGGARLGLIAPDATTFAYLDGRPHAPFGEAWDRAVEAWAALPSDADAVFDREVTLDGSEIAPVVTWGTSPEDAAPITASVPDPAGAPEGRAAHIRDALAYMDLAPGRPLDGIAVDASSSAPAPTPDRGPARRGRRARRPHRPGARPRVARLLARQGPGRAGGLDRVFTEAGLEWVASGCSMCVGMNGDVVPPGDRCASTTNRNFRGRQGPGARTHLMSPAMVAAAAVAGHLTDVRPMLAGRA
jgi:3-isopropylmalate/(R)-2-methylmalate dehydratase large subunit